MTKQDKQIGDPDDFVEGTYRLAVSNECFKTDERALAAGGAQ